MALTPRSVFRYYETDGVPSSGAHKPSKADIIQLLEQHQDAITAFTSNGGLIYDTKASIDADLAHGASSSAWVISDATVANNGIYRKSGASGAGSWSRVADLPYSFIKLNDVGAGTPNAIIATSAIPLPAAYSALMILNVFEANTADGVTLAVNGGAAKPLVALDGSAIAGGALKSGMALLIVDDGSNYRALSDFASAANLAAAEAARDAAIAAASSVVAPKATRAQVESDTPDSDPEYYDVAYYDTNYIAGSGGRYRKVASEPAFGVQNGNGTWYELDDPHPNVAMYGGADAGITAMAGHMGFVAFPRGETSISAALTISVPSFFRDGAYLTIATGVTLTITNRITSPRQWIFRGDGNVRVNISGSQGEDARMLHASWFGAIPTNTGTTNLVPYIQKAFDAFSGQSREGVLDFDQGSYHVESGMTIPRGVWVRCSGTRRMVFDVVGSGYDVLTADGDAVRLTGLQFEQPGTVVYRTGALIVLNGQDCEIDDVWLWGSEHGIVVNGANAKISNVNATYGVAMDAGSSAILVKGNGCMIDGVRQMTSGFGPTAIIEVGKDAASNFGFCSISNVQVGCPSIPVLVNPSAVVVSRLNIHDVIYSKISGTNPEAVVKLATSGTGGLRTISVSKVSANSTADCIVKIDQASSGISEEISLVQIMGAGAATGISLAQSAGTLRDVKVSDSCELSSCTTPISYSGTMSEVRVSPSSTPNGNNAYCYQYTIADDSVMDIDLRRSVFSLTGILNVNATDYGFFAIRAASSPGILGALVSANVASINTALTGITGTDGKITVGVQDKHIYIENRKGSSITAQFTVLAGIA